MNAYQRVTDYIKANGGEPRDVCEKPGVKWNTYQYGAKVARPNKGGRPTKAKEAAAELSALVAQHQQAQAVKPAVVHAAPAQPVLSAVVFIGAPGAVVEGVRRMLNGGGNG